MNIRNITIIGIFGDGRMKVLLGLNEYKIVWPFKFDKSVARRYVKPLQEWGTYVVEQAEDWSRNVSFT